MRLSAVQISVQDAVKSFKRELSMFALKKASISSFNPCLTPGTQITQCIRNEVTSWLVKPKGSVPCARWRGLVCDRVHACMIK